MPLSTELETQATWVESLTGSKPSGSGGKDEKDLLTRRGEWQTREKEKEHLLEQARAELERIKQEIQEAQTLELEVKSGKLGRTKTVSTLGKSSKTEQSD